MTTINFSIHPRHLIYGRNGVKKNTCANSSLKKRMARAIAGMERHLETNPNDAECRQRITNAQARAS